MACKIKNCKGKFENTTIFRLPTNTSQRNRWIQAIEHHQKFDYEAKDYYVCMNHFDPNEIRRNILEVNAVPSIFLPYENTEVFRLPQMVRLATSKRSNNESGSDSPMTKRGKVEAFDNRSNTSTDYNFIKPCEVQLVDINDIKGNSPVKLNTSSNAKDLDKKALCSNCFELSEKLQKAHNTIGSMRKQIDSLKAEVERLTLHPKGLNVQSKIKLVDISKLKRIETIKSTDQAKTIPVITNLKLIEPSNTKPFAEAQTNSIQVMKTVSVKSPKPNHIIVRKMRSCKLCKLHLSEDAMIRHLCFPRGSISCKYCQKAFKYTQSFLNHLSAPDHAERLNEDRRAKKFIKCDQCQLAYPMAILLEFHKKSHELKQQPPATTIFEKIPGQDNEIPKHTVQSNGEPVDPAIEPVDLDVKLIESAVELDDVENTEIKNETVHSAEPNPQVKPPAPKTVFGKMFKCGNCGDSFKTSSELAKHMRETHIKSAQSSDILLNRRNFLDPISYPMPEKMFKCGKCGASFKTGAEMSKHMRDSHNEKRIYECYICKKQIRLINKLQRHIRNHFKYEPCVICKESLDEREVNTHLCGDEKSIRCEYCDETFTATTKLLVHLESSHEQKKLYRCDKCTKFLPMVFLKNHHQHIDIPKPFMCNACPKTFATDRNLKSHEKTHDANRDHLCDECGMSFLTAANLLNHKRYSSIHSEPTFQCPDCPSKFYIESRLKKHRTKHKGIIYVCEICKNEHRSKIGYEKHIRTHKRTEADRRYHCKICPKKFFEPKHLHRHYIVHSGEKQFFCRFCDAAYKHHGDLNKHMRSHVVDGKIHECDKCTLSFYYPGELQDHLAEHFKEERAKLAREQEENDSLLKI